MPTGVVVSVVPAHVRGCQPLHPLTQVSIVLWPQHHMKMVWHQAVAEQTHGNPISSLLDQLEKRGIVTILVEDRIPTIATVQNVVANITERYPRFTGHPKMIRKRLKVVNNVA